MTQGYRIQGIGRKGFFLKLPLEGKWLRSNRKGDLTRVKLYSLSRTEDLPPRSWGKWHVVPKGVFISYLLSLTSKVLSLNIAVAGGIA